jgi:guanosine-3',5'-bis(diphosphate) 3'-pyrophosphohydrolase
MSQAAGIIDFHHPPTANDPDVLFAILESLVSAYLPDPADLGLLARAYALAAELHQGMTRDSGEPYITHPLHVALILAHLRLDVATLAAGLLHDVLEDTSMTHQGLVNEFGREIADLVEGVTKLTQVSRLSRAGQSAANIQKVFVAMSEELRVIFIKLADRLHNLRTLDAKQDSYSRERTALEALEVYARIADRLGIAILRKEIEDIAFSYLNPEAYERVKASIEARYAEHRSQVEAIERKVKELLRDRRIHTAGNTVQPNPRRVYDMFRRLQEAANPPPSRPKRVLPQLRFHVIVEDVPSCYMAMAAIHSTWPPIASEIRDYISAPLSNGYQSLHTTVFVDEMPVKFQIRTLLMHHTSQLGIIAYMQEGKWQTASPALKQTVDDLRQFGLEAVREFGDPVEFLSSLKGEILGDDIYVYTPKNKVIQLPVGSTPVDFAYRIHTDIGHRCRGALVDGHWVPLNRPLRTGEQVEILTARHVGPRFEWLNPDLGYTISPLAKGKIRRWFRRRPEAERVALGERELRRIVDRLALDVRGFSELAKRWGYPSEMALFRDIGGCDLAVERVWPDVLAVYAEPQLPQGEPCDTANGSSVSVGSLESHFAACCKPKSGDDIVGYILAPAHVVEVHRSNCPVFLNKIVDDKTRFVEVKWGPAGATYLACLEIYAHDRPFLLRDVWEIISEERINVADVDIEVNRSQDATIATWIDVENWLQFNRVLSRIEDLPGVIYVRRKRGSEMRDSCALYGQRMLWDESIQIAPSSP